MELIGSFPEPVLRADRKADLTPCKFTALLDHYVFGRDPNPEEQQDLVRREVGIQSADLDFRSVH